MPGDSEKGQWSRDFKTFTGADVSASANARCRQNGSPYLTCGANYTEQLSRPSRLVGEANAHCHVGPLPLNGVRS